MSSGFRAGLAAGSRPKATGLGEKGFGMQGVVIAAQSLWYMGCIEADE